MPAPLYKGPQPPDAVKLLLLHPKDVEPLGWKSFEKTWVPCLLVLGFPPPASFLRVTPPMDKSTLPRVVLQQLGCVQGTGVRKEEGMGHKPWVFLLALSTLTDNLGTGLSPRLWLPQ